MKCRVIVSVEPQQSSTLFLDGLKDNDWISKEDKTKYRDKVSTMVGRCELLTALLQKQKKEAAARTNSGVAGGSLTSKEIRVLRKSSFIRNLGLFIFEVSSNEQVE